MFKNTGVFPFLMGGVYQKIDPAVVRAHYSRPEILTAIVANSANKEVVGSYGGVGYAKRPDIIEYEQDILELVKRGATSFHASEELWGNPLSIATGMSKKELSDLRTGWDLLLDIDCAEFAYSRIATDIFIRILKGFGINNVSVKFSGNHGFHIAVPFESFPKMFNGVPTAQLFPEAPRAVAELLKQHVVNNAELTNTLLEYEQGKHPELSKNDLVETIAKNAQVDASKLVRREENDIGMFTERFELFEVLEIDTILITSRHLYRQVYSLNEKSGLVSIPINPDKVLAFDRDLAKVENNVFSRYDYMNREKSTPNEGAHLLIEAYDVLTHQKHLDEVNNQRTSEKKKEYLNQLEDFSEKIPDTFFPKTIVELLGKLSDGKKRAMFIIQNFLRCVGYADEEVEAMIIKWNKEQHEPLREAYLDGQIRHFKQNKNKVLPPNYTNDVYFSIVRHPLDYSETKFKNPVAYSKIRYKTYLEANTKPVKKKKGKKEDKKDDADKKNLDERPPSGSETRND